MINGGHRFRFPFLFRFFPKPVSKTAGLRKHEESFITIKSKTFSNGPSALLGVLRGQCISIADMPRNGNKKRR